jgi:ABC-type polysaccharide/polyol phosphate transport system ATPase subunit
VSAITLEGVGKRYRVAQDESMLLRQLLSLGRRRKAHELWALRDIDLTIEPGETVGIIGRNGSGKTTMLRLLAGVSAPTVGRLRVEGSIAPLIGVGVGFNPELTGRENVFANGRILGMGQRRLEAEFDDIVAFAELEEFVDSPVKFYSSGMFLRLAFAVAIHIEPEVLLVDEVLAVGDIAFQLKCFERMRRLQEQGTTIVVVTHNLQSLGTMCRRALVLSHGRNVFDGDIDGAIGAYHQVMYDEAAARGGATDLAAQEGSDLRFSGGVRVVVAVLDADGSPTGHVPSGGRTRVRVRATFEREVRDPLLGLKVGKGRIGGVYMMHTLPGSYRGVHGPDRPLDAVIELETPLLAGSYEVSCNIFDEDGELILGASLPAPFFVVSRRRTSGIADLQASVVINGQPVALPDHDVAPVPGSQEEPS